MSPEDVQLGSSWARSINSIDSRVTASRRVCRRRRALAHRNVSRSVYLIFLLVFYLGNAAWQRTYDDVTLL